MCRRKERPLLEFLSTLSLRRATPLLAVVSYLPVVFLSTLSLRRATDGIRSYSMSINISIHALLAESDIKTAKVGVKAGAFLSTLSLRRATANWFDLWGWAEYFYPRSPCGERLVVGDVMGKALAISIHALLAESDLNAHLYYHSRGLFLSTLSLRRATPMSSALACVIIVFLSTLSLRRATVGPKQA